MNQATEHLKNAVLKQYGSYQTPDTDEDIEIHQTMTTAMHMYAASVLAFARKHGYIRSYTGLKWTNVLDISKPSLTDDELIKLYDEQL